MELKEKRWKTRIVSLLLQFIFLFPLAYNPVHYLFVEHFHHHSTSIPSVDAFHNNCKLDDYNIGKSADIQPTNQILVNLIEFVLEPMEIATASLAFHNYLFLLRAPPVFGII